ncbi:MAG: phosphohistidine phosphatase [Salinisphaeraceae bacterium]|jgi:phosphohistidine phosphatase|nr:phosphohistidine phosphatase [Salinisphaeraceae bacterium]
MDILVFRHGIALEREEAARLGLSDAERPVTDRGRVRTRAAARGLMAALRGARVDAIVTSPYLRAAQTAALLAECLQIDRVIECDALVPGQGPSAVNAWLREQPAHKCQLLVGHEPDLSEWVSWGLTRRHDRLLSFKKAGCCLLEFPGSPEAGTGNLRWLLTAAQLRALA